jgi:DNA-directed RNA polymerase subunit E'/Rpb7
MKSITTSTWVCFSFLIFVSVACKKLERDNPLDGKGTNAKTPVVTGVSIKFSKYEVFSDNNSDKQINKGESIKLKVYVRNNGDTKANKVRAAISCSSPYVSALGPVGAVSYYNSSYDDYLDEGEEGSPYAESSYPSFNISNNTPGGTVITFTLAITDEANHNWTETFSITVTGTGAAVVFSRYEIYSDNNADQRINKGESIKLKVFVKNNGTSKANKVRVTITSASSYVSALSPLNSVAYYDQSYDDYLDPGAEGSPYADSSYLSFNVSNTTPAGSVMSFSVTITDESNNTWTDSFTATVVATTALIKYEKFEVYSDNNSNQQINPGESVKLKVYLINNGSSKANKLRATISCSNSYVSSLSPVGSTSFYNSSYSDFLLPGEEGSPYAQSSYLGFNVSGSTPGGTVVTFNISIVDESNNTWSDAFTITVY